MSDVQALGIAICTFVSFLGWVACVTCWAVDIQYGDKTHPIVRVACLFPLVLALLAALGVFG